MDYEQLGLTLPESTLLWADRRASARPLLESVLALLTRAIAGPNISGSFAKLSPDGLWLKTALGCSQLTMDGSLEIFSGVWPRRATMSAGIVGEPPTSERRINGTGYSSSELWRTPDCADAADRKMRVNSRGEPMPSGQVKEMWPTPTTPNGGRSVAHVDDWRSDTTAYHNGKKVQVDLNAAVKMWRTPSSQEPGISPERLVCADGSKPRPGERLYDKETGRLAQFGLTQEVKMWPTPTATEGTHGGPNQRDSSGRPGLTACVKQNWATPNAGDAQGSHGGGQSRSLRTDIWEMKQNWPTPTTRDYKSPDLNPESKRFQQGTELNTAVAWNTPTCNDAKNATLPPSMGTRDSLTGDLIREGAQGALNPDWVETLQGYEPGWTRLPDGWKIKGGRPEKAQNNTTGSRPE